MNQKRRRDASPQLSGKRSSSKRYRTPEELNDENEKLREELREMREGKTFYKGETARLRSDRNYWYEKNDRNSLEAKQREEELMRKNSLLQKEIYNLKNSNFAIGKNTEDVVREDGEIDDSDDDDVDIQAEICGFNKNHMCRRRYKGIVIKVKSEKPYLDGTIISQNHIYSPTLGLLYSNNRKNRFMEMGSTYEFSIDIKKNVDEVARHFMHTKKAADWHGIRLSQIQTSCNPNFEATIEFHHCQIREYQGEHYVLHEALNKVTIRERFIDRLDWKNWVRDIHNKPGRQATRIRAKVNLIENYQEAFEKNREASIFQIKELVTVVDCHTGSLLPVEGLTTFRKMNRQVD